MTTNQSTKQTVRLPLITNASISGRAVGTVTKRTHEAAANAILESLVADSSLDQIEEALSKQGFGPEMGYRYHAKLLKEEADSRRIKRLASHR